MSVLKGYPGKKRDLVNSTAADIHVTAEPIGQQVALNTTPKGAFLEEKSTGNTAESGSTVSKIVLTAHSMQVGDVLRFDSNNLEARVVKVEDANTVLLGEELSFDPTGLDFSVNRHLTPKVNSDGTLPIVPGPIRFLKDSVQVEVTEDTVTPANNIPLPVKLTSVTGDINITANDLNVQTQHNAASPDSMQIGDGVEIMEINASGEATVSDADSHTKLDAAEVTRQAMQTEQLDQGVSLDDINSELDGQTTLLTSLDGKDFATDTELALKLDEATWTNRVGEVSASPTANTMLGRLKDVDDALASLLAELELKADLSETQPVSAASLPLPSGASTEAKQDAVLSDLLSIQSQLGSLATETSQGLILAELQLKADLTETQPVSLASQPLPTGAATEATLASLAAEDFASQTTLAALLTELQLKADLSETQPVSAASLPLPTGAATEASLSSQAADISLLEDRLPGGLVTDEHDYIETTYVASGNGEGEIETVTYKTGGAAGSTVATLTLAYDASNRLTSVTKA